MSKILFICCCLILCACQQKFERQLLQGVPPGTQTLQYTDSEGNSIMVDTSSLATMAFNSNTIFTTPPGAQFTLIFPDNSRITLNAATTIHVLRYDNAHRTIYLSGEAYFEVKSNPQAPFTVRTDNGTMTAYGTTFNIQAYPEDPEKRTTLIEGSLKISNEQKTVNLKPGQQVILNHELPITTVDLENALAWKDGYFNCSDLETMLRQISRWYDARLTLNTGVPKMNFEGRIPSTASLEAILKILRANGINILYHKDDRRIEIKST